MRTNLAGTLIQGFDNTPPSGTGPTLEVKFKVYDASNNLVQTSSQAQRVGYGVLNSIFQSEIITTGGGEGWVFTEHRIDHGDIGDLIVLQADPMVVQDFIELDFCDHFTIRITLALSTANSLYYFTKNYAYTEVVN